MEKGVASPPERRKKGDRPTQADPLFYITQEVGALATGPRGCGYTAASNPVTLSLASPKSMRVFSLKKRGFSTPA